VRITNTILSEPFEDEEDQAAAPSDVDEAEVAARANGNGHHEPAKVEQTNGRYVIRSNGDAPEADLSTGGARVGDAAVFAPVAEPHEPDVKLPGRSRYRARLRKLIEESKEKKTPRLILQIWQSDYSIIAFVLVVASFYLMKDARYPPIGLLFFTLAMATIDAILSIFVVRLSFHQNKHGFYRTEDFERDWLRYRILLSMTKAALLFLVATTCGTAAVFASYIVWFFTSTQRLRYFILRWSMDDHYPELQRFSIFTLLKEFGVEPKLKNFNLVAILGLVIGFAITFIF
jgi:hypothetical protein